jgi:hypothetical protein
MESVIAKMAGESLSKLASLIGQNIYIKSSKFSYFSLSFESDCVWTSIGSVISIYDSRHVPLLYLSLKDFGDHLAGYDFKGIEDCAEEENILHQINFGQVIVKSIKLHFYFFDSKNAKSLKGRNNLFVDACTGISFFLEDGSVLFIFPPHLHGVGFSLIYYKQDNYDVYRDFIESKRNVYNEKLFAVEKDIVELLLNH